MKWLARTVLFCFALFAGPLFVAACGHVQLGADWRTADRSSASIAPDPASTPEAIVEVYAARAFNWRGIFGVHTWIATKAAGATGFTVHQVLGWNVYFGRPAVASSRDLPDRSWFGNPPRIIAELRGAAAARAIPAIEAAVARYPYRHRYTVWPGPNSNTFTAYIAREVPALGLEMPANAIGKDFLTGGRLAARAPSGTGYQVSLLGLLGVLMARREGLEVNILGLTFGVDPLRLALKLPGIGRLGFPSARREARSPEKI